MKRRTKIIVTAALLLCSPLSQANADIFQYTDENGVLHFTNVNSGGKNRKKVKSGSGRPRKSSSRSASSPQSRGNYAEIIRQACDRHGVDPALVKALIRVESGFDPYALSRKGAMGLMQLMPQTALAWNVRDSFDPAENIDGGVKYLRHLIDRYEGNLSLALAAYNSGETAVKRWGTIPPFKETQNYVRKVMRIYGGSDGDAAARSYADRYTIYMGYSDDGVILLTDNPSSHPDKKLKARKKNL